jgi:membrane associated rhomboid family serine protease
MNNQSSWDILFLFNPAQSFKYLSLSLIFSIFFHSTLYHFVINIISFLVIGAIFEQWQGRARMLFIFLLTHLLTLMSIYLNYMFKGIEQGLYYSGASAGVLGLLLAYLFLKGKKFTYIGIILILIYETYTKSPLLIDPHLIASIMGLILAFFLKRLSILEK